MMLQEQVVSLNFGQGLDGKTDPKLVVAGKMLRLENAVFTSLKRVSKRNGYQAIPSTILSNGAITSPKLIKSYKSELLCAASGRLYSYSNTQSAWIDKGKYVPVSVRSSVITKEAAAQHTFTSGAAVGNIAVYVWEQGYQPWAVVVDLATNMQVIPPQALSSQAPVDGSGRATSSSPKVCVVGGNQIGVFYRNTSGLLVSKPLWFGLPNGSLNPHYLWGAETVLTSSPQLLDNGDPFVSGTVFSAAQYSVEGTTTGAMVFVSTTTGLKLISVAPYTSSDVFTVIGSTTVSSTANVPALTSAYDSVAGQVWVYWTDNSGALPALLYAVYSSTLSAVLSPVTTTCVPSMGPMSAIRSGTGAQILIFAANSSQPWSYTNQALYRTTCTVSGTATQAQIGTNVLLHSKLFSVNGANYFGVVNYSKTQPTLFILDAADGQVVARCFSGQVPDYRRGQFLSAPIQISSTKILIAASTTEESVSLDSGFLTVLGASAVTLDFNDPEAFQTVDANGVLLLNGGLIYVYDGQQVNELGFHLFPDNVGLITGSSGSMADGTYTYYITYRWTDAQGNIYESSPSVAGNVTISNGGANNGSVMITVDTLALTAKVPPSSQIELRVYRTSANGSAAIAYDINSNRFTTAWAAYLNNTTARTFSVMDTANDSTISKNNQLYTDGGVIENICPPPALAFALHNNRVWLIDSENPNQLWYSKSLVPGAGVNFSDLLTVQVNAIGGKCVALAPMDDKLVILEERLPLVMAGDGANDAGTGSTLTNPQPIPSDAGCSTSKGVAVFPMGVLRKTAKGIYLLDRSLSDKYWGIEVEQFNSQNIQASTVMPDRTQIRFLTDSGLTLVYDYVVGQWASFTNHTGWSADVWNGSYVYARTDGQIFQESAGFYLDGAQAFSLLAQTSWLAMGQVQGFQRVRRLGMLGDYRNGGSPSHGVSVSAAYDFSATFSAPVQYNFGAASGAGVFQYRERLPVQKCSTLSLIIQEVTTGNSSEYIDFTDLSFEVGVKSGLKRMSSQGSVG